MFKTLVNAGSNLDFSEQNPPYETLEAKKVNENKSCFFFTFF
jgi:hypothetical protein